MWFSFYFQVWGLTSVEYQVTLFLLPSVKKCLSASERNDDFFNNDAVSNDYHPPTTWDEYPSSRNSNIAISGLSRWHLQKVKFQLVKEIIDTVRCFPNSWTPCSLRKNVLFSIFQKKELSQAHEILNLRSKKRGMLWCTPYTNNIQEYFSSIFFLLHLVWIQMSLKLHRWGTCSLAVINKHGLQGG